MIYQLTDLTTNKTTGFATAYQLREFVIVLTKDIAEGESVFEWATTPVIGGWQYDGPSFTIRILD